MFQKRPLTGDIEGRNFRLAGWIAKPHIKGTGLSRTGLVLSIKKPPDRRQAMEHLRYPNESTEYRAARNALLNDEIALRAQIETVAAKRRALPPGGKVSEDYVFERIGKNAAPEKVMMSELFGSHDTLILYSFMYGPERELPCPGCTHLLDGLDGAKAREPASGTLHCREVFNRSSCRVGP